MSAHVMQITFFSVYYSLTEIPLTIFVTHNRHEPNQDLEVKNKAIFIPCCHQSYVLMIIRIDRISKIFIKMSSSVQLQIWSNTTDVMSCGIRIWFLVIQIWVPDRHYKIFTEFLCCYFLEDFNKLLNRVY